MTDTFTPGPSLESYAYDYAEWLATLSTPMLVREWVWAPLTPSGDLAIRRELYRRNDRLAHDPSSCRVCLQHDASACEWAAYVTHAA